MKDGGFEKFLILREGFDLMKICPAFLKTVKKSKKVPMIIDEREVQSVIQGGPWDEVVFGGKGVRFFG